MGNRKRVLVTGHAGYIGSVMVPVLQDQGHEVVGLDAFFFDGCDLGSYSVNVPQLKRDIRDVTPSDLKGFDAVVHLAALSNDPLGNLNRELTLEINYRASVWLALAARQAGVKRFLFSSSCSIYGASDESLLTEESAAVPLTAYAESKVRTEEEVRKLAADDFSPVFMRNATAYGFAPRFRADVVLNNLTCWAFTTGRVNILSDGMAWRPLVHVEDICLAFAAALVAPREVIHNQAFNIGSTDQNYRVRELADIVREVVPRSVVQYGNERTPDARNYRVDFSKADHRLPGFRAKWNAYAGVHQLYAAFQQHGLKAEDFQGRRFTRLPELRFLLDSDVLDGNLRWVGGQCREACVSK